MTQRQASASYHQRLQDDLLSSATLRRIASENPVPNLAPEDLDAPLIASFLHFLEVERNNSSGPAMPAWPPSHCSSVSGGSSCPIDADLVERVLDIPLNVLTADVSTSCSTRLRSPPGRHLMRPRGSGSTRCTFSARRLSRRAACLRTGPPGIPQIISGQRCHIPLHRQGTQGVQPSHRQTTQVLGRGSRNGTALRADHVFLLPGGACRSRTPRASSWQEAREHCCPRSPLFGTNASLPHVPPATRRPCATSGRIDPSVMAVGSAMSPLRPLRSDLQADLASRERRLERGRP